jgi:hypothetical protein
VTLVSVMFDDTHGMSHVPCLCQMPVRFRFVTCRRIREGSHFSNVILVAGSVPVCRHETAALQAFRALFAAGLDPGAYTTVAHVEGKHGADALGESRPKKLHATVAATRHCTLVLGQARLTPVPWTPRRTSLVPAHHHILRVQDMDSLSKRD